MGNYVYCIIHIYRILREHWKLCLLNNSHFRWLHADMGNFILYIHIYRILREYGKLCLLYIHIYRILREYGKLCILYNSYLQYSTRTWETMFIIQFTFQGLYADMGNYVYCIFIFPGFYANMGNYKGFGDCKFIPGLEKDKLELLVKCSTAAQSNKTIDQIWTKVSLVYALRIWRETWDRNISFKSLKILKLSRRSSLFVA